MFSTGYLYWGDAGYYYSGEKQTLVISQEGTVVRADHYQDDVLTDYILLTHSITGFRIKMEHFTADGVLLDFAAYMHPIDLGDYYSQTYNIIHPKIADDYGIHELYMKNNTDTNSQLFDKRNILDCSNPYWTGIWKEAELKLGVTDLHF